jgi:hypothetical protein
VCITSSSPCEDDRIARSTTPAGAETGRVVGSRHRHIAIGPTIVRVGNASSPSTVTEAVEALRQAGYTADYQLVDGVLRADGGNAPCPIEEAVVERFFRFEGPSDPGDQMIVLAVRDPNTGVRGSLAVAYGPAADPRLYQHLSGLGRDDD